MSNGFLTNVSFIDMAKTVILIVSILLFVSHLLIFFILVSEETESCQCCETEGSHQRKWHSIFCIWIYERKSLSVNKRQVCKHLYSG